MGIYHAVSWPISFEFCFVISVDVIFIKSHQVYENVFSVESLLRKVTYFVDTAAR